MYEFVRGPLVWIAFIGFFGGMAYRFIMMAQLAKKDRVVYPTYSAKYGLRSLLHWVVPFGGRKMRMHPVYTLLSYAFHICVLVTPLFLMGHAVLWQESQGQGEDASQTRVPRTARPTIAAALSMTGADAASETIRGDVRAS